MGDGREAKEEYENEDHRRKIGGEDTRAFMLNVHRSPPVSLRYYP
jgi:hypothetical protein